MRVGVNGENWQTTVTIPFELYTAAHNRGLKLNRILKDKLRGIIFKGESTIEELKEANAVMTAAYDKNSEKLMLLEREIRQFRLSKQFSQGKVPIQ